jgi:hypothetical protein
VVLVLELSKDNAILATYAESDHDVGDAVGRSVVHEQQVTELVSVPLPPLLGEIIIEEVCHNKHVPGRQALKLASTPEPRYATLR